MIVKPRSHGPSHAAAGLPCCASPLGGEWTATAPTEPGYYWAFGSGPWISNAEPDYELFQLDRHGYWTVHGWDDALRASEVDGYLFWSTPLKAPPEPDVSTFDPPWAVRKRRLDAERERRRVLEEERRAADIEPREPLKLPLAMPTPSPAAHLAPPAAPRTPPPPTG